MKRVRMLLNKRNVISVIVLFMLTTLGLVSVKYLMPPAVPVPEPQPTYRFPKPELDIHGFSYKGMRNGKTILTIAADRFGIRKKKIGPFSIGLIREVVFEKAVFRVFGRLDRSETGESPSGKNGFHADRPFSEDLFRQFPVKGMTGMHAGPFAIEFYNNKICITRIFANEGDFELKNKGIVLRGHVRAESGARRLYAKTAKLSPDRLILAASNQNFMETHGRKIPAKDRIYDLLLKPITQN